MENERRESSVTVGWRETIPHIEHAKIGNDMVYMPFAACLLACLNSIRLNGQKCYFTAWMTNIDPSNPNDDHERFGSN